MSLEEVLVHSVLWCEHRSQLRVRTTSKATCEVVRDTLDYLTLDVEQLEDEPRGETYDVASLSAFLARHPRVRRLSLRKAILSSDSLERLLAAAAKPLECDLTLVAPLDWATFSAILRQAAGSVSFSTTLDLQPSSSLSPREVVVAQCYGLHCGRPEVCYRFASPKNRRSCGFDGADDFARLFEGSSRYNCMLLCDAFTVGYAQACRNNGDEISFDVIFEGKGGKKELFLFQLSRQRADPEAVGPPWLVPLEFHDCYMTDGVIPVDVRSMWDGSFLEE
eukprot:TRINITY_DN44110_c0_g1_i1.p1 TRINITY_DN44110_c0_g1~~TRINITY_DN44110_c0_g1_i1.p1  ORF type:complete len:278 (+),score=42.33 TRINITY_DN44110_c0_g1_i1:51-884(+)